MARLAPSQRRQLLRKSLYYTSYDAQKFLKEIHGQAEPHRESRQIPFWFWGGVHAAMVRQWEPGGAMAHDGRCGSGWHGPDIVRR